MADIADVAQERIDAEQAALIASAAAGFRSDEPSAEYCDFCGVEIPQARRELLPGVQLCVDCQSRQEQRRI